MQTRPTLSAQALLQRSLSLQEQARNAVARLRVRERWEQLGPVYLVGSARFGLMVTPNVDFEVYVEHPDVRAGFAIMAEIAAVPGIRAVQHHNFMDTADPGLYWRVDYTADDGTLWDFDIWLVPFSHPHAGMANAFAAAMERDLTPETRVDILRLKTELAAQAAKCGTGPVRGIDIYRAVLEGGVRDTAAFSRWQADNPPPPMETWRPVSAA